MVFVFECRHCKNSNFISVNLYWLAAFKTGHKCAWHLRIFCYGFNTWAFKFWAQNGILELEQIKWNLPCNLNAAIAHQQALIQSQMDYGETKTDYILHWKVDCKKKEAKIIIYIFSYTILTLKFEYAWRRLKFKPLLWSWKK